MSHREKMLAKYSHLVNKKLLLIVSTIFIFFLALGIGIIIGGNLISRPPMIIDKDLLLSTENTLSSSTTTSSSLPFVASKRGKYYYPSNCSLAQGLSEKNKVYFKTRKEAEGRGYRLNPRCK